MIHQNQSELANVYAEINGCLKSDQNQSEVGSLKRKCGNYKNAPRIGLKREFPVELLEQRIHYKLP